jgi:hypothetical protein
MKKALLSAILALCSIASAVAQGSVVFSNSGGSPITCGPSLIPTGSTFQAELMYAPDGTASAEYDSLAVRVGAAANFGPTPGFFSGGGRTINSITPAGGFGLFQVRVWTTAFGGSYNEVIASGMGAAGKSSIMRVDTGNPLIGEPATGLVASGLQYFFVGGYCIPEPPVIGIGLVAGAALLVAFYRKRHVGF